MLNCAHICAVFNVHTIFFFIVHNIETSPIQTVQLTDALTSEGKDLSSINDPIGKFYEVSMKP